MSAAVNEQLIREVVEEVLGRIGSPEEAANAVLFMCSPLSDYVTGEVLIASGEFHF